MYALHPGSLPPKSPYDKQRIEVSADDLARYYKLQSWEYIVWDPADPDNAGLEWFDFIHLYPMFYGHYKITDGKPEKDNIPCEMRTLSWTPANSTAPKPISRRRTR